MPVCSATWRPSSPNLGVDGVEHPVIDRDPEERGLQAQPGQAQVGRALHLGERPGNLHGIHRYRPVAGEPVRMLRDDLRDRIAMAYLSLLTLPPQRTGHRGHASRTALGGGASRPRAAPCPPGTSPVRNRCRWDEPGAESVSLGSRLSLDARTMRVRRRLLATTMSPGSRS